MTLRQLTFLFVLLHVSIVSSTSISSANQCKAAKSASLLQRSTNSVSNLQHGGSSQDASRIACPGSPLTFCDASVVPTQCCPGVAETGGQSFPCPGAPNKDNVCGVSYVPDVAEESTTTTQASQTWTGYGNLYRVRCPGSNTICNSRAETTECCPGVEETDGLNFPCPGAPYPYPVCQTNTVPEPSTSTPVPTSPPANPTEVRCPGTFKTFCNSLALPSQCCPGIETSNGSDFPCPGAPNLDDACQLNYVPQEPWMTVFTEAPGAGNETDDESDDRLLNFPQFAELVDGYSYEVKLVWGSTATSWIQFTVPNGYNIFAQVQRKNIPIVNVTSSNNFKPEFGSGGFFCHACVLGGKRWGDTCWGVLPSTDRFRGCGCNRGRNIGEGIYYGGMRKPDFCKGLGGGFAGPKLSGERKGAQVSLGLTFMVKLLSS